MKVYVVGAGSIGTYLGGLFAAQGAQVLYAPRALDDVRFVEADLAILAVKAYDTDAALIALRKALGEQASTTILCPQNGIGNEEKIAAVFGKDAVVACALTVPVDRGPEGTGVAANAGGIATAPMGNVAHNWLAAAFMRTGVPFRLASDYRSLKWSKLSLNILANATCAILDILPEEVVHRPDLFALEMRALAEARAVMGAQGIALMDLPRYPVRLLHAVSALPPALARMVLAKRIAGARGRKPPSLLLDLRAGKKKTEAHVLNGAVAEAGRVHGVPTPVNDALTRVLAEMTSDLERRHAYRGRPDMLCAQIAKESSKTRFTEERSKTG